MAFLKSSQITGLSAKDVDVRGFTQANSINLGDRAYTEHEVLLADAYSITGDVTISDNLILAKLSDDGEAITLTGNATTTRTISGSGSLEGSTFAQTPNASLTGMTGVIGSAVTGSPTLALTSAATFPAGHVLQVKRIYLKNSTSNADLTYGTSSSALNGTLDSNGIYRLKNADGEYMTIPNFSATSGNMLIAWGNYLGTGGTVSASNSSFGVEWGSAALRTYSSQGYNYQNYTQGHFFHTSTILTANLSSVNVHGILRIEEVNKTTHFRFTTQATSTANWGTEGASAESVDISLTIMEIQQ